jgi:molybdopterin-guanine dinucleotide biosynthesis protein B
VDGYRILRRAMWLRAALARQANGGQSMRVIAVSGLHRTGKTTTVEHIVRELTRRGYTVGTVKSIPREGFSMDTPGKNTYRHKQAGAEIVAALSPDETAIIIRRRLAWEELLSHYDTDWVIIEGAHEAPYPRIVCARTEHDIEESVDDYAFLICGEVASKLESWRGLPVIDATSRAAEVVNMVESQVSKNAGKKMTESAGVGMYETVVCVNGEEIPMVPFVQDFIARTILGMLSSLRGYEPGGEVRVEIRRGE